MDAKVRIRLAMGVAARDFAQTHAVDNPEFKLVLGELDEFIGLAQTLATEQREGHIDRHAASLDLWSRGRSTAALGGQK